MNESDISSVREQGGTMDADARSEAIDEMTREVYSSCEGVAEAMLDALLSPREVSCDACEGTGEVTVNQFTGEPDSCRCLSTEDACVHEPGECPPCSGSGCIEKGPIAYLAGDFEQAGTLTEDYIDGEWRGRIAGYMTTNAIATRRVPLLRVRPDESPKGGA